MTALTILACLALAALAICSPSILAWAMRSDIRIGYEALPFFWELPLPPEQPAPRMHGYTPAPTPDVAVGLECWPPYTPPPERVTVVREHTANGRRVRAHVRKVKVGRDG